MIAERSGNPRGPDQDHRALREAETRLAVSPRSQEATRSDGMFIRC